MLKGEVIWHDNVSESATPRDKDGIARMLGYALVDPFELDDGRTMYRANVDGYDTLPVNDEATKLVGETVRGHVFVADAE